MIVRWTSNLAKFKYTPGLQVRIQFESDSCLGVSCIHYPHFPVFRKDLCPLVATYPYKGKDLDSAPILTDGWRRHTYLIHTHVVRGSWTTSHRGVTVMHRWADPPKYCCPTAVQQAPLVEASRLSSTYPAGCKARSSRRPAPSTPGGLPCLPRLKWVLLMSSGGRGGGLHRGRPAALFFRRGPSPSTTLTPL